MELSKGRNLKCEQNIKYKSIHFSNIYYWEKLEIIEMPNMKVMIK